MIFCESNASLRCWKELLWIVALYLPALGVIGCLDRLSGATLTIRIVLLSWKVYSGHMYWPHTDGILYSAVLCTIAVVVVVGVNLSGRYEPNVIRIFFRWPFSIDRYCYKCTRKHHFFKYVFRNDGGTNIVGYPRSVVKPYDFCAARIPPHHDCETVHGPTSRRRTIIKFLIIRIISWVIKTVFY